MKIAVLSGKGGTGKTFVSVNLSAAAEKSAYIDCDVEEPNGHLFLKPHRVSTNDIFVKVPLVDKELCTGCRKCIEFCKFNALAYILDRVIVFEELCHSCGGCSLVCPTKAISEKEKKIGEIKSGTSKEIEGVKVLTGILNVGEVSGIPIIKELLKTKAEEGIPTFIDCPPGSACIVMESIKDADYCILVAEPTIFGMHNLSMVHELVKLFNKPHGVVLNKCLDNGNPSEDFCLEKDIKILSKIAFDDELGLLNSNGLIAIKENEKYRNLFDSLLKTIINEV